MKKYLSVFLAFLMILALLSALSSAVVFADDKDGFNTPDDAFDGGYTEFEGKDGSVTRVFDNGSVSTKYKDGTTSAVDYSGNQYSEDKDGNSSVRTTDGYIATEYSDGRKSVTEPGGKTTTMNTDGSFSESFGIGYTLDYNAEGALTGVGITGSNERIGTDENGCFKNGEIAGPGGSKLKITDNGIQFVNAEGTEVDYTDDGDRQKTNIKWKDGAHSETETTVTWNGGEKTEDTNAVFTDGKGNRWDSNKNTTYDSNGEPKYVNNNVTEWTGADGSKLWVDNSSKAMEYSDKDGNKMITDAGGNLTEYKDGGNSWKVTYDGQGNVTSAEITYADGATMIKKPDGSTTFTLPDGTKYESDSKGNVTKNGVPVEKGKEAADGDAGKSDAGKDGDDNSEKTAKSETASDAKLAAFMGTWHYSESYSYDGEHTYIIHSTWIMNKEGNKIKVSLAMTDEDGTENKSYLCDYQFDGTTLTMHNAEFEGGKVTFTLSDGKLNGRSYGEDGDTVIMTR